MNNKCYQETMKEPEILFEWETADRCKCLQLNEFLFEWETAP